MSLHGKKNTILLIYPPGGYGTFLDWCINWFSGHISEHQLPFLADGSSHGYRGAAADELGSHKTLDWYLRQPQEHLVIRTHMPVNKWSDKHQQPALIKFYAEKFHHTVMIDSDTQYHLLTLHNMCSKIPDCTYQHKITKIKQRFCKQFNAVEPVPRWQLREMISFWHEDYRCWLQDFHQPLQISNGINVTLGSLLQDLEGTIVDLFNSLGLPLLRINRLPEIKNQWLSMQAFQNRDEICRSVVSAVVHDRQLEFGQHNLHLFDEAYIQFLLRQDHGVDLQCQELDVFPRSASTLRKIAIPYVDKAGCAVL